jgi:hypothetical protein
MTAYSAPNADIHNTNPFLASAAGRARSRSSGCAGSYSVRRRRLVHGHRRDVAYGVQPLYTLLSFLPPPPPIAGNRSCVPPYFSPSLQSSSEQFAYFSFVNQEFDLYTCSHSGQLRFSRI